MIDMGAKLAAGEAKALIQHFDGPACQAAQAHQSC